MEKIRILYLITDLGKGGAERFLIDLANELRKHEKVEFLIGTLFDDNQYKELTKDLPIIQLNFKTFSFRKKNECPKYKSILEDFKPDIVHTHRFLAEFLSSYYLSDQIIYVCHGHDNMIQLKKPDLLTFFNKTKFLNFLERQFLIMKKYKKVTTYFIANSTHTKQYYENTLPSYSKHEIHLIQNGFNYNRFYNPTSKSIKNNDIVKIVNVGSFQPKKNQIFIVDIAKSLSKYIKNFEIHLLGDGEMRPEVEQYVENEKLSDKIFFHGNVNKVEEVLKDMHIYLHTAWYEPFGLVFLEAMAAGLPIITLDGKGNRDLIENGRNGFIFEEEDADKFAKTIYELVVDENKYSSISAYGKEYAKHFDMKYKIEDLLSFYESILKRK